MKKIITFAAAMAASASTAMAGGLLTNTNQNAAFLRQMSQNGNIDITSLYCNPAGTAFLQPGFHLSLNVQNAKQSRDITTTFPLFAYNVNDPNATHRFEGKANAPVIPSFQASYNWDRWSAFLNFALGGGGGKCEFDNGLGTFEALYSSTIISQLGTTIMPSLQAGLVQGIAPVYVQQGLPEAQANAIAQQIAATAQFSGYSMNSYMKGRNYQFHVTAGGTYKILDNLSVSLGLRAVYATNNYNGYVMDVNAHYTVPANATYQFPGLQGSAGLPSDISLNCDQTGFTLQPIIGIDWRVNSHWNLAAKFEAPTKLKLKNKTEMNEYAAGVASQNDLLGQFADGRKVREDLPGILALGGQYSPVKNFRINAGWNYYFDKQCKKEGNKQDLIDKGTMEVNGGVEWDICKWLTVSGGWQSTNYRLSDDYMNDLTFNLSSNAIGLGVRLRATERCTFDLGYMHSFYHTRDVVTTTAVGDKTDHYYRTNRVFGLGVNFEF
ncbi:MAG: OmpP1/FadL family transporter [Bacteroidaceae bacterium]